MVQIYPKPGWPCQFWMILHMRRFTPNLGDLKIKNYLFLPSIVGDFKNDYESMSQLQVYKT